MQLRFSCPCQLLQILTLDYSYHPRTSVRWITWSLCGLGRSCRMSYFEGATALKLSSWYVGNAEARERKFRYLKFNLPHQTSDHPLFPLFDFEEFRWTCCSFPCWSTPHSGFGTGDKSATWGCVVFLLGWLCPKVGAFGYCDAARLGRRRARLTGVENIVQHMTIKEERTACPTSKHWHSG